MVSALLEMPGPMRIDPQLLAGMQSVQFFCGDQITFVILETTKEQSVIMPPVVTAKQEPTSPPNEASLVSSEAQDPNLISGENMKISRNNLGIYISPRGSGIGSPLSSSAIGKRILVRRIECR